MNRCLDPICLDGPPEGDDPRPRWALAGSALCRRCGGLLEQRLVELGPRRDALRAVLGGLQGAVSAGNKPTKGTPPVPLNIAAHDHLTLMQATVASWVRLVCEERDLRGPDRNDLAVLMTWLLSQLSWLLEHPAVGDLADEMRDLSSTADALAQSTRQPTRAGADCFDCGGHLLRRITSDGLEEDHVTCTVCHVQYEPSRYTLALKAAAWDAARVVRDGEAWATPASLAHDLGMLSQTIRKWQNREQVRSRRIGGMVFVNVADVEDRHSPKGETA